MRARRDTTNLDAPALPRPEFLRGESCVAFVDAAHDTPRVVEVGERLAVTGDLESHRAAEDTEFLVGELAARSRASGHSECRLVAVELWAAVEGLAERVLRTRIVRVVVQRVIDIRKELECPCAVIAALSLLLEDVAAGAVVETVGAHRDIGDRCVALGDDPVDGRFVGVRGRGGEHGESKHRRRDHGQQAPPCCDGWVWDGHRRLRGRSGRFGGGSVAAHQATRVRPYGVTVTGPMRP
ncbi:hypothetical protein ACFPRL_16735 [Pseudoclavibacter helvolus]